MSRIPGTKFTAGTQLTMHASVKDYFFDRALVLNKVRAANVKRLGRIGAYVRQRGKSILRRRKRVSNPGETPSVRSRDTFANLRNILFAMDRTFESVVIGPRFVPSLRLKRSNRHSVPELLERGGDSLVTFTKIRGKWEPGDRAKGRLEEAETVDAMVRYAPRPFMGPALDAEIAAGTLSNVFIQFRAG